MAKLISEDRDYPSYMELTAGSDISFEGAGGAERWQYFSFRLGNGDRILEFESPPPDRQESAEERLDELKDSLSDIRKVANGYLLCRHPTDEAKELADSLGRLSRGEISKVIFEPLEPSFELRLLRQGEDGLQTFLWIDEGNVATGICRWDGLGIRFFTTYGKLAEFLDALKNEFGC